MIVKGNKILQNVKTRSIIILNPTKWVILEYRPLMTKMTKKHEKVGLAQTKFDLFFDISIIIGIASLLLMLQTIHYLIKFSYKK